MPRKSRVTESRGGRPGHELESVVAAYLADPDVRVSERRREVHRGPGVLTLAVGAVDEPGSERDLERRHAIDVVEDLGRTAVVLVAPADRAECPRRHRLGCADQGEVGAMDLTPVVAGEHVPVQRAGVMMDAVPAVDGEFVAAAREAIKEGAVPVAADVERRIRAREVLTDRVGFARDLDLYRRAGDVRRQAVVRLQRLGQAEEMIAEVVELQRDLPPPVGVGVQAKTVRPLRDRQVDAARASVCRLPVVIHAGREAAVQHDRAFVASCDLPVARRVVEFDRREPDDFPAGLRDRDPPAVGFEFRVSRRERRRNGLSARTAKRQDEQDEPAPLHGSSTAQYFSRNSRCVGIFATAAVMLPLRDSSILRMRSSSSMRAIG